MKKTAIITGGSAGIGQATAQLFLERGWRVIAGARREERLKQISTSDDYIYQALDVTSLESVASFFDLVAAHTNKTGSAKAVLVNNAGLARGTAPVKEVSDEDIQEMLAVNVAGLLRVTRSYLKYLGADSGHIINLSSISGHQAYAGGATYCATKHGVQAIAGSLKHEVNGTGTRISNISPGLVETEFSQVRLRDENANEKVYKGMTPLAAKDIAECIWFAASQPAHVNIDEILVTPTDQASATVVHRQS